MKRACRELLGMVLFQDFKPTPLANLGIFISITGSMFFAYLKYKDKQAKQSAASSDVPLKIMTEREEEKVGFLHHRTNGNDTRKNRNSLTGSD